jgi:cyclopropane fatty-acyl-phospholipid synthase-like methyltransferase
MSAAPAPLKRPAPPGRSAESLRNHYEVEREIAARLLRAPRDERSRLYRTMYDELFTRVPDHPRLLRREDAQRTRLHNRSKLRLLRGFLGPDRRVAEFAPGDCRFCLELCGRAASVTGIDISDQRGTWESEPANFRLVIYDGYELPVPEGSLDLVFSDQLIEHLHPEDTGLHFRLVQRMLAPGGVYLFRTPHALCGPHDVSRFFSDEPEGFHLKEWTYGEIAPLLRDAGFQRPRAFWTARGPRLPQPFAGVLAAEGMLRRLPPGVRRHASRLALPNLTVAATR